MNVVSATFFYRLFVGICLATVTQGLLAQSCDTPIAADKKDQPSCKPPPVRKVQAVTPAPPVSLSLVCSNTAPSTSSVEGFSSSPKSGSSDEQCTRSTYEPIFVALATHLPWPLFVLLALLLIGRKELLAFGGKISRVKGAGLEVEFTPDAAGKIKGVVNTTLKEYVKAADEAYSRQAVTFAIRDHLEGAVDRALRNLSGVGKYRATVHVPDVVYADYLYQLLDYFPAGSGAARRFSKRRGILGKVWRLGESVGVGNVIRYDRGPANESLGQSNPEETLIREWSMTREEVRRYYLEPRLSFLCVVLRVPYHLKNEFNLENSLGRKVGVFYMDSIGSNTFGDDNQAFALARALEQSPELRELAKVVDLAMQEMRKGNLNLSIQDEKY